MPSLPASRPLTSPRPSDSQSHYPYLTISAPGPQRSATMYPSIQKELDASSARQAWLAESPPTNSSPAEDPPDAMTGTALGTRGVTSRRRHIHRMTRSRRYDNSTFFPVARVLLAATILAACVVALRLVYVTCVLGANRAFSQSAISAARSLTAMPLSSFAPALSARLGDRIVPGQRPRQLADTPPRDPSDGFPHNGSVICQAEEGSGGNRSHPQGTSGGTTAGIHEGSLEASGSSEYQETPQSRRPRRKAVRERPEREVEDGDVRRSETIKTPIEGQGEAAVRHDKRRRQQAVSEAKEDEDADEAEHGRKKRRTEVESERESQPSMAPMSVHAYENVSKEKFESLIVRPGDVPGREQLVDWYHAQTKVMRWMTTSITKRQWGVAGQARDSSALSTVLRLAARAIYVSTHFRLLHNRLPQCPDPSVEKVAIAMHNRLKGCIRRKLIRGLGEEVAFCLPQIEEVLLQVAVGASRGDHGPITSGSMRKPTAVAVASLSEQFYQGVWRRIVDLGMRMSGRQPLLDIREFLRRHPNISAAIPETSLLKKAIREAESDQLGADARPSTPLKASTLQTREDLFALAQELFTPDIPYTAEPSHGWDSLLTQLGHDLRSSITRSHRSLALQRDTRSMDGLLRHVTRALIGIARTAYLAKFYPSLKVHPIVLELRVSILTVWTSLQIWSSAGERLEVLLLRHGLTATAPWRQQAANESEGEVQSWDRLQLVEKATQYGLARMQPLRIILESFESDEEWQRGLYGREGPERLRQLLLCIGGPYARKEPAMLKHLLVHSGGPYARKEPAMLKHLLVHSGEKAASLPASSVSPPEPHDDHAFTEQTKESVENDESASETTDADSTVSLDHGLQTQDDGATLDQEDSIALAPEDQRHQMPVLKPALETQQAAEEAPSMVESDSHAALDVTSEMPIPDALPDDASGNADTVMADVQPPDEAGDDTPIWIPTPADHQLIDEALSMLESDDHEAFEAALEAAVNELFYGETDES